MTTIHYNVPGSKRKELVKAISTWTGVEFTYAGAPTFVYQADGMEIDRDGNFKLLGTTGGEAIERLMEYLYDEGFECDLNQSEPEQAAEPDTFEISVPIESANRETMTSLIASKEALIKKALGISDTRVIFEDNKIRFPWFVGVPAAEETHAYTEFISALCKMSKSLTRVNSSEKEVPNEKYAFRCFLLRLGFIGDEFKKTRKILLRNLSGSSAFKTEGGEA